MNKRFKVVFGYYGQHNNPGDNGEGRVEVIITGPTRESVEKAKEQESDKLPQVDFEDKIIEEEYDSKEPVQLEIHKIYEEDLKTLDKIQGIED